VAGMRNLKEAMSDWADFLLVLAFLAVFAIGIALTGIPV
jgi:hypothetical protein